MTQAQLDCAVAGATGESLQTIHRRGFSIVNNDRDGLESEDPALVLDCPSCGRAVPYPGRCRDGSVALAECLPCDVYFDCDEAEVYTIDPGVDAAGAARAGVAAPD